MGLSVRNHGVKYMAAASFVVFVWLVWRLGLHEVIPLSPLRPSPAPIQPPPSHPMVIDDDAEAEYYCSNFRLKPFARDRVRQRKIYDLLLVNTELEMLEMRMGQMSSGVDYFVVVESDKTFTDHEKPLYVAEAWDQFAAYHPQMIRHTMNLSSPDFKTTWMREGSSRNAMYSQVIPFLEGDRQAHEDDVLLVSDIDEIFKPETLKVLRNCEIPDRVTAQARLYYYSYQWRMDDKWMHPQATVYKGNETVLPQDLRPHGDGHFVLSEAAWHCSYCFPTVKEFVQKITSFSHSELDQPEFKDPEKIVWRVRNGHDLFERVNATRIEANRDMPDFLLRHTGKFEYMVDRNPPNANFRDYTPPAGWWGNN